MHRGSEEVRVAAPPQACFDALTDYEHLPDWQGPLKHCEVLDHDDAGRGRDVRYEVDAKLRRVTYTLRHGYDEPGLITSEYLGGDFKAFDGRWTFVEKDGGTLARIEVEIDPGVSLPGPAKRLVQKAVLKTATRDLKRRVES
jgi:ribosome-associated toxin RatA of RatAB toxin-antitoxin module